MSNNGKLAADPTINLSPKTSILKHQIGDEIALNEADFTALSAAFFTEIDRKFV